MKNKSGSQIIPCIQTYFLKAYNETKGYAKGKEIDPGRKTHAFMQKKRTDIIRECLCYYALQLRLLVK